MTFINAMRFSGTVFISTQGLDQPAAEGVRTRLQGAETDTQGRFKAVTHGTFRESDSLFSAAKKAGLQAFFFPTAAHLVHVRTLLTQLSELAGLDSMVTVKDPEQQHLREVRFNKLFDMLVGGIKEQQILESRISQLVKEKRGLNG